MSLRPSMYKLIYAPPVNLVLRSINKFLSPILPARIKIPPSGIIHLRNKEGNTLKIKTNQTSYLTYVLFWEGYSRFEYTDIFIRLIKNVRVFYDVGANIGYYSLLAARENPMIRIVAFEPASGPLFYLNENVRINHFTTIQVEAIALSDQEGSIEFYEIKNKKYPFLEHHLSGENHTAAASKESFAPLRVKTETLDAYVDRMKEDTIDLIKMDTEGTEHFILHHAHTVLSIHQPIVICETWFNSTEADLESIFSGYGYSFYNHTAAGLQKVDSLIRQTDDGVKNCFFVHPSKISLIEEFII